MMKADFRQTNNIERAFVLHTREYSETSLLVDFFCEQSGKITLIAKGARRIRSPLKSLLQPFTPLFIKYTGKSALKTLTQCESASISLPMKTKALYSGFYLNEILIRTLTEGESYDDLFISYLKSITNLAQYPENIEEILREFEFVLLKHLGYEVDFFHCGITKEHIEPQMLYQYHSEQGFIASLLDNQNSYKGEDILAFGKLDFAKNSTKQAAKKFTRIALKPYLGVKPLKSRELFASLLYKG